MVNIIVLNTSMFDQLPVCFIFPIYLQVNSLNMTVVLC